MLDQVFAYECPRKEIIFELAGAGSAGTLVGATLTACFGLVGFVDRGEAPCFILDLEPVLGQQDMNRTTSTLLRGWWAYLAMVGSSTRQRGEYVKVLGEALEKARMETVDVIVADHCSCKSELCASSSLEASRSDRRL